MPREKSIYILAKSYLENDPAGAAKSIEAMAPDAAVSLLKNMPAGLSAGIFPYVESSHAAIILQNAPEKLFRNLVEKLEPRHAAPILLAISSDKREELISSLPERTKEEVREMLTFPEDSAGRIMSTEFIAFKKDTKVKNAVKKIRAMSKKGFPSSYVYVVDNDKKLAGVINMRDLMLASGNTELEAIMIKNVFSVDSFTDREEVAEIFSKRRYFAVPVVNSENRILGIIRSESIIGHVQEEASEDIQKMFGAGGDEKPFSPVIFSMGKRLPWLHINLVTAFIAAFVVSLFEGLIAKITILAVFLPVVAGEGGNAGAQSLAIVMRGIVMKQIPAEKAKKMILKEAFLGLISGVIIGVVTGFVSWLWYKNPFLGVVIGLAMIVNLVVAGFAGAAIPITMKSLGFDPAQSSNILLTTITDVIGFFAFLGLALVFQAKLI